MNVPTQSEESEQSLIINEYYNLSLTIKLTNVFVIRISKAEK